MRCKICNKKFEMKRDFSNILEIQRYYICDTCYRKYPISLDMFTIPLSNGRILYIYTMFEQNYLIDTTPFIKELSILYKYCLNKYKKTLIFLENGFRIDDKTLFNYDTISKIEQKNIVVITDFIMPTYV